MQQVSAVRGAAVFAAILFLIFLPGCGGGGNSTNGNVTSLTLTPTSISLNEGGVAQLSVTAFNAAGVSVPADITFSSNNTKIATVSSGGLICGGVWDSNIINCNATQGQGGVGKVTITATATAFNVTATTTVYVHERVDFVETVVGGSCTTMGRPITISGKAFSTSAPGCSTSSPCDITSTVGPFSFGSNNNIVAASSAGIASTFSSQTNSPTYVSGGTITGAKGQTCNLSNFNGVIGATATVTLTGKNTIDSGTHLDITAPGFGGTAPPTTATLSDGTATCSGTATVITALTTGVLTAQGPGATTLFASVSGVNGVGAPYLTCPVASITVHGAGTSNTSFTVNPTSTQDLKADVLDTNGQAIAPTLTWGSSSTAAATVTAGSAGSNSATATGVSQGAAYITASCNQPTCNIGVSSQYSQNVVTINVPSGATASVYAASTNSKTLVPINTQDGSLGAAITLPHFPNSIIADPSGSGIYLGSAGGLMAIPAGSSTVTTFNVTGTILAISPDSRFLLLSDNVNHALQYFDLATATLLNSQSSLTANASAYTPDSAINLFVNSSEFGIGLPSGFLNAFPTSYAPSSLDVIAQGGLFYISSATDHQIHTYSTCNQVENQVMAAGSPTLIKAIPNGTGAVAVDPPSIDVITTPSTLSAGCPVTTQSTINSYDLGAGNFTPQQLIMSSDATTAWVISDLPEVIAFNLPGLTPTMIPLAGGAIPFNGGLTLNGTQLWVGANDNKVHQIFLSPASDVAQIAPNLKDANGNVTAPNLVTVLP